MSHADDLQQAVVGWGRDSWGEATVPQGFTGIKAISATAHSVALRNDGTVYSWGHNVYGEATVPAGLSGVTAIAAGGFHTLALKDDGTVVAWGQDYVGQATVPAGLDHVVAISGGRYHSLALKDDGTVVAWGSNSDGQSMVPVGLHDVVAIDGGGFHSLALLSNGTVVAWGANGDGQSTVPAGLNDVVAVAAGWYHSLALKSDGTVVAWGENVYGQATVPAGLPPVAAISAGATHSLVAFRDGTVATWGDNAWGQMQVPTGLTSVTRITGKAMHSLVMADDPPPSTVVGLAASVASTKVTLTWGYPGAPTDHDFDRIVVRRASGEVAPATVTDGVEVPTGRPRTTLVNDLISLAPGDRYSYSVFAVDRAGNVGAPVSVTVPLSFREPVTDAAAVVEGPTSVALSWRNPGGQLSKIVVRRAVGAVAPSSVTSGSNVSLSSPLAESVTNGGLLAGTQYSYSIFAQDRVGNVSLLGSGSTVTVTTTN